MKNNILEGKRAVIFGGTGSIGSAVAAEMAASGAEVFLAGRSAGKLEELVATIRGTYGKAHAEVVDALDDDAVNAYVQRIARTGLDIAFNAVGPAAHEYGNTKHAVDIDIDQFMVPVTTVLKSQFITARAAARVMKAHRSGVVIFLTGSPARGHVEGATAIGAAFGAIETLMENMAVELGPYGVRSVCLRTTANVDSRTMMQTMDLVASQAGVPKEQLIAGMANMNFLKRPASIRDTAKAAVLIASDYAGMLTGTVANFSAGAAID